jgi:hypothetical protein
MCTPRLKRLVDGLSVARVLAEGGGSVIAKVFALEVHHGESDALKY